MTDVTLSDLVQGLERQGDRYQALDVFASNIRELRQALETSTLGQLEPVDRSHPERAFTFEHGGKHYQLRLHESGVARLTRASSKPSELHEPMAAPTSLKAMVGSSTDLPGMILGFLVGTAVGIAADSPRHVLTIRYDEQERQWRAYDGPLAKWMREVALKAELARG